MRDTSPVGVSVVGISSEVCDGSSDRVCYWGGDSFALEVPSLMILDALVDRVFAILLSTLIGRFFGFRPNINVIRSWVLNNWNVPS